MSSIEKRVGRLEKKVFGKVKKEKKIYITFVIDESGSMSGGRFETIKGINTQIAQIHKDYKDTKIKPVISFIKFGDNPRPVFLNKGLEELREIGEADYKPYDNTAMYDAVGFAIEELEKAGATEDKNTAMLVIVVSDGYENASKKYSSELLAEKVKTLSKTDRFTITYLGANQDLSKVSKSTGILSGNFATFDSSSVVGYSTGMFTANCALHNFNSMICSGASLSSSNYFDFANSSSSSKSNP